MDSMSYALVERAIHTKIGPTEKLILITMANFANTDGTSCYPSLEKITELTGLSRRTVIRGINKLAELRLLRRCLRGIKGRATQYQLYVPGKRSKKAAPQTIQESTVEQLLRERRELEEATQ
jgi:Helix-turn-helix domain